VGERQTLAGSRDSKLGAETQSTQVQQAIPSRVHFADEYVPRCCGCLKNPELI
jgi:hypothetical protein